LIVVLLLVSALALLLVSGLVLLMLLLLLLLVLVMWLWLWLWLGCACGCGCGGGCYCVVCGASACSAGGMPFQPLVAPAAAAHGTPPPETKEVQATLTMVSKTHTEWDKKRREYASVLSRSSGCAATAGSRFHAELVDSIEKGAEKDNLLMTHELSLRGKNDSSKDLIAETAATCEDIGKIIKRCGRKSTGLKAWIASAAEDSEG